LRVNSRNLGSGKKIREIAEHGGVFLMHIVIEGYRSTDQDWLKAQQTPSDALPRLTEEQKQIASTFGASSETYARSLYAGELSQRVWEDKAKRLGQILESLMTSRIPDAEVLRVTLQTSRGVFEVVARAAGSEFKFRVQEDVADELMEGGDADALDRLRRIVEFALLPLAGKARAS
jgi:hypothetical protein